MELNELVMGKWYKYTSSYYYRPQKINDDGISVQADLITGRYESDRRISNTSFWLQGEKANMSEVEEYLPEDQKPPKEFSAMLFN